MKENIIISKKAFYFLLDAIFASMLLLGGLLILSEMVDTDSYTSDINYISKDVINILTVLTINDMNSTNHNNSFIVSEIENGNITNIDNSILEQVGEYWARNEIGKASQLLSSILSETEFSSNIEIAALNTYRTEYDTIFSIDNTGIKNNLVSSRRMVSGIEKGKPIEGSTSTAYLRKIENKRSMAYAYFGGFIGQGNLTFFIDELPDDIETSTISYIYLEGDFGGNFSLYINNNVCIYNASTIFYPNTLQRNISKFNMTSCAAYILPGRNNFSMKFYGDVDYGYVAGGFLRIDYTTDAIEQQTFGDDTYYFIGVKGVANIFDSFYVPGTLQTLDVMLHFNSSYRTFLTIGERVIDINVTGVEQYFFLNNSYLLNDLGFDYEQLSNNTVPIRFASYNASTFIKTSGDADVVLITDYSASMWKAVNSWTNGNNANVDCISIYDYPDIRRTHLAICLDYEFINTILNYSGNKLWPVFMYNNMVSYYNNPTDADAINAYIRTTYTDGQAKGLGDTCLACALNLAYEILNNYSSPSRKKIIVLMTDGVSSVCASGSCISNSSTFGTLQCMGLCDTSGLCDPTPGCIDCTSKNGATNNTYYSANRTVNDLNARIYTIGFGPVDVCSQANTTLSTVAEIGNGTYQHSTNVTMLKLIYQNITDAIMTLVELGNQSVIIKDSLQRSEIYWDSHINYTYTPIVQNVSLEKILITLQKSLTECTSTVYIPNSSEVIDAKVVSYSGTQWSDLLVVNGQTVFNLSDYYVTYNKLGDPFVIQLPTDELIAGNNTIFVDTGESPTNRTGCSKDNSIIYSLLVNSNTARTGVMQSREGCNWSIMFFDGELQEILIPSTYSGDKHCSYKPTNITYYADDSYDVAVYGLFHGLDLEGNGRIYVDFNIQDLEVIITTVGAVPYLWGPSIIEARVWR